MLDKRVFGTGFTLLCEMFDKEPSEGLTKLYYEALKTLSDTEFQSAVNHIVNTRKFTKLPLPAEFLDFNRGNREHDALRAWHKVDRAVRSECGSWKTPIFDDPVIHIAISRGFPNGWIGLCEKYKEDNATWIQRDFIAAYEAYQNTLMEPTALVGRLEAQNDLAGIPYDELPVFIGEKEKCLELAERIGENIAIADGLIKKLTKGEVDETKS